MTATAIALEPQLDLFEDANDLVVQRPDLRLVHGTANPRSASRTITHAELEVIRRRRFLALLAITVAVLITVQVAGLSLFSLNPAASATPGSAAEAATAVHVVRPGDSYAAIASLLGADKPNAVASQLQAANGGGELVVGQRLVVDLNSLGLAAG